MFQSLKSKLIALLIVITFFTYFPSLSNPFIWDDEQFITTNQYVQQFTIDKIFTTSTTAGAGVVSNYYRPLTTLSFAIDNALWHSNTFGFHLTNLGFHIGAGVLLFLLLLQIGVGEWGSFFISLFFLIHPIQTEAVTYINSRGDSLFAFFLFASLLIFAKGLSSSRGEKRQLQNHRTERGFWVRYAYQNDVFLVLGSVILFTLSILAKETALVGFPLFFVLVLIKLFKTRINFSQSIQLYILPLFVAGLSLLTAFGYMLLRLTVLNFQNTLNYYDGATFYSTHLLVRLFTFARVVWTYLGLLVWPYPLHMERDVALISSAFSWEVWGMVVVVFSILYLVFWEIRKKHTAFILFGFALSSCLLIPVSGVIPINGILYEHWLYVPMVGFFIMLYGILQALRGKGKGKNKILSFLHASRLPLNPFLISFALLLTILYIVLTIRQNNIWADPVSFYRYTLSFAPTSARLHNNLGMSLSDAGDNTGAITEYKKALMLGPDYPQIYNNLGNVQMQIGDYQSAEKNLGKALELAPNFGVAKANLVKVYLLSKQYDKARSLSGDDPQVEEIIRQIQNTVN